MRYFFILILSIVTNSHAEPVSLDNPDPAAAFAEVFGGEKISNHSFMMPYIGNNINLSVVKFQNKFYLVLPTINYKRNVLNIIKSNDTENVCLIFIYDPTNNTGELDYVGTKNRECLPDEINKGNFLMGLTDQFADKLSLNKITLIDVSTVTCKDSDDIVDLKMLNLITKGKTWYESLRYKPVGKNYEEYRIAVDKFRNYSVAHILNELNKIKSFPWETEYTENFTKNFEEFKAFLNKFDNLETLTLAELLTKAWEEDCNKYIMLNNFLFPSFLLTGINYEWHNLRLDVVVSDMEKDY